MHKYGTKREVYEGKAEKVGCGHKQKDGSIKYKDDGRPHYRSGRLMKKDLVKISKDGKTRYVSKKKHEAGKKAFAKNGHKLQKYQFA